MRLIQLFVPADEREAVTATLDELSAEYLLASEADDGGVIALVPVPTGAVDDVLARLRENGLDADSFTVVSAIETATTPKAALSDRFVELPAGSVGVSYEELRTRARNLKPERRTFLALSLLSALVAAAGLLLNSAIIVVGAMVIAPFAGSALSASVGAVIGDRGMLVRSVGSQVGGLLAGFVGAVALTLLVRWGGFVPDVAAVSRTQQLSLFVTPSLLAFTIAVCAGFAGGLALATDLPVSIAGVAVAAAIVPSAATVAIGVVWRDPVMALGAFVLLVMNIVFINVAAYAALVAVGYGPSLSASVRRSLAVSPRTLLYLLVVGAFAVALVFASVATVNHLSFERQATADVEAVLSEERYRGLQLVSVTMEYSDDRLLDSPNTVTVTVSRTSEREYRGLAKAVRNRIARSTNQRVEVQVHFVDYQVATARSTPTGRAAVGPPAGAPLASAAAPSGSTVAPPAV